MRRLIAAGILACLLSVAALAGDIPISDSPAPSPLTLKVAASGQIPTVGVADQLSTDALSALLAALTFLTV